jgi:hypothetical protein
LKVASVLRFQTLKLAGIVVLLIFAGGCSRQQLGLPRIAAVQLSPNGNHRAWVKNHLSFDPPAQSLWVRDLRTNEAKRVLLLAEDQDWCRTIEWAADGSALVFVVQDARAVVYDVESDRVLADAWLVSHESYPTKTYADAVSFGALGQSLVFRECHRNGNHCSDWITFELTANAPTPS